jgi:hypothetical protein
MTSVPQNVDVPMPEGKWTHAVLLPDPEGKLRHILCGQQIVGCCEGANVAQLICDAVNQKRGYK